MSRTSWKKHFSRFLGAVPGRLHFAAHSHHPWPDVSFEAQQEAWLDAARLADLKWDKVFSDVLPRAQAHVARLLKLPDANTIAFAPNTHELVMRLLSCLPSPARVLTTDSEFHSFSRQMKRYEEDGRAQVTRIAVEPYATFAQRFASEAARGGHDLVYFSQCFYNTGFLLDGLDAIVGAVRDASTLVVIDGYHGFMAVPTNLSAISGRAFYLAGGYKYAMAGEGACFMHCPPGQAMRPPDTGWYAAFGTLTTAQTGEVPYAEGGARFMGATYDPTALYRLVAVHDRLRVENIGVTQVRAHVESLQDEFLSLRDDSGVLKAAELMPPKGVARGNFLVFRHGSARALHDQLLQARVLTDCRDDRLRIGFGIHQDAADLQDLFSRAAKVEGIYQST